MEEVGFLLGLVLIFISGFLLGHKLTKKSKPEYDDLELHDYPILPAEQFVRYVTITEAKEASARLNFWDGNIEWNYDWETLFLFYNQNNLGKVALGCLPQQNKVHRWCSDYLYLRNPQ